MSTAEVVIIGAGVIGASIAHHLAARGCTDVLVIDQTAGPGRGSTGRATGGFRAQFGSEINVRLSLLAREKLLCFEEETGVDPGYRPAGYLFLASERAEFDALLGALAVQRAAGLTESHPVGPEDVRRLNPAVGAEMVGGTFCPSDGYIQPLEILRGYIASAERLGVRFAWSSPCIGITRSTDRIRCVRTISDTISAGSVVIASGAWAAGVAAQGGVALPIRPERRQVAVTHPCSLLPEDMSMTIFVADGFHLRVRDGRILLLLPQLRRHVDEFNTSVEDDWLRAVVRRAGEALPCLRGIGLDRASCWAGLYEVSPDSHVLLGRAPGVANLYLANGSSGHGVMHAPALGQLMAEILLEGRARTVDAHPLRASRFSEGDPILGSALL